MKADLHEVNCNYKSATLYSPPSPLHLASCLWWSGFCLFNTFFQFEGQAAHGAGLGGVICRFICQWQQNSELFTFIYLYFTSFLLVKKNQITLYTRCYISFQGFVKHFSSVNCKVTMISIPLVLCSKNLVCCLWKQTWTRLRRL